MYDVLGLDMYTFALDMRERKGGPHPLQVRAFLQKSLLLVFSNCDVKLFNDCQ